MQTAHVHFEIADCRLTKSLATFIYRLSGSAPVVFAWPSWYVSLCCRSTVHSYSRWRSPHPVTHHAAAEVLDKLLIDKCNYSAPVGERSIAISLSVCLCVCACLSVREHISGTAGPIFTKFFVQIRCGCGSILLWLYVMYFRFYR